MFGLDTLVRDEFGSPTCYGAQTPKKIRKRSKKAEKIIQKTLKLELGKTSFYSFNGFANNTLPVSRYKRFFKKFIVGKRNQVRIYSIDGSGNNPFFPSLGVTGSTQLRLFPNSYADGISQMRFDLPNPRALSNAVGAVNDGSILSKTNSVLLMQWGQWIDHDLDSTPNGNIFAPIILSGNDPFFGPQPLIPFNRAQVADGTGTSVNNPASPINSLSPFIDGSAVYGSDPVKQAELRGAGGFMDTYNGFNTHGNTMLPIGSDGFYKTGDSRGNEQFGLTSTHALFVSEHNRAVQIFRDKYFSYDPYVTKMVRRFKRLGLTLDDAFYEMGRKVVTAQIQAITYNEYLPQLIGEENIRPYQGYKPWINPQVSVEFTTAAFRLGHTQVRNSFLLKTDSGYDTISLAEAFFNPQWLKQYGPQSFFEGAALTAAGELDGFLVEGLRQFLVTSPEDDRSIGLDLFSINLQRGRDTGTPLFNDMREALGFERYETFDELTGYDTSSPLVGVNKANFFLARTLENAYGGDIDLVDPWIGIISEVDTTGSNLGDVGTWIVGDQFMRSAAGDINFFKRDRVAIGLSRVVGVDLFDHKWHDTINNNYGTSLNNVMELDPNSIL